MTGEAHDINNLFEIKYSLLLRMSHLLDTQILRLDDNDINGLNRGCSEVDTVISDLRKIGSEISKLRLDGSNSNTIIGIPAETAAQIIQLAEQNFSKLDSLSSQLLIRQTEVKKKLDDTVASSQITGYRPNPPNQAIYLDRRN
jgi:hypothetical protein